MADRVMVFIDYQNVHLIAHRRFWPAKTSRRCTHVDPGLLARRVAARVGGDLVGVRVYRGQPAMVRQPGAAAANSRQADAWATDPLVTVIRRPVRYPANWPDEPAQEKGIDVALAVDFVRLAFGRHYDLGILVSRDTDLMPCLEAVHQQRYAKVQVAIWNRVGRLRFTGSDLPWCHFLNEDDYHAVHDPTDYTVDP